MDPQLTARLSEISREEMSILSASYDLPSDAKTVFANMKLKRRDYLWNVIGTQQMITANLHTRFVDIPIHSHSYIEIMYVCEGTITHFIEGNTVVLEHGELLLLNRHAKHSIAASGSHDIGANLIVSPDFLSYAAGKYRNSGELCDFAAQDSDPNGKSRYLIYRVGDIPPIENLLENLIRSTLFEKNVPQILLSETLSLLFRYLEMYPEALVHSTAESTREDKMRRDVTDYIQTNYRTASLSELAGKLGMSPPYTSRLVRELFGAPFCDLVKEKRFSEAEQLLLNSDLSVSEIIEAIGYENNSFFHRRFREQYGMSPGQWRKNAKS